MSVKIGKFIAERRKKMDMTQEELAEKLGVSSKSISRWENNVTMPDLSLLTIIAKELKVEISELLNGRKMTQEELVRLRETIDKLIKHPYHQKKSKINKLRLCINIGLICLLIVLIEKVLCILKIIQNDGIIGIITSIILIIGIILNIISFYSIVHKEFKINLIPFSKDEKNYEYD